MPHDYKLFERAIVAAIVEIKRMRVDMVTPDQVRAILEAAVDALAIRTFRDIIELWPSSEQLAEAVKEEGDTVRAWKFRNSIPPNCWEKVVRAAIKRGRYEVTNDLLARLAAHKGKLPPLTSTRR